MGQEIADYIGFYTDANPSHPNRQGGCQEQPFGSLATTGGDQLFPRVVGAQHLPLRYCIDPGVEFGSGDVTVSQHLLDIAHVYPILQ